MDKLIELAEVVNKFCLSGKARLHDVGDIDGERVLLFMKDTSVVGMIASCSDGLYLRIDNAA